MKEHRWVIAASRLLAIYFAFCAVGEVSSFASTLYYLFTAPRPRTDGHLIVNAANYGVPAAAWSWAAWLFFFRAARIQRVVTRGLHPDGCCQRCGYNLAGAGVKGNCPECGHSEPIESP